MNEALAETPGNYSIDKAALTAITAPNIELQADKMTVKITLAYANRLANDTTYLVGVSNVIVGADLDQMTANYSTSYTFSDKAAPTLGTVSYTNNTTAKVSFSEPMNALVAANVRVYDDQGADVTSGTLGLKGAFNNGDIDLLVDLTGATASKVYTVKIYGATDVS